MTQGEPPSDARDAGGRGMGAEGALIRVWPFYDAPEAFRALSPHGGDEDWIADIPDALVVRGDWIGWAESGTPFGTCDVSEHPQPDGSVVRIGAHA